VKLTLATSVLTTVILTGDFYIYLIKDLNYIFDSDFLRRRSDIRSDVFVKSSQKLGDTRATMNESVLSVIYHDPNMIIESNTNASPQDFANNG
jgi:hypothetical protein